MGDPLIEQETLPYARNTGHEGLETVIETVGHTLSRQK